MCYTCPMETPYPRYPLIKDCQITNYNTHTCLALMLCYPVLHSLFLCMCLCVDLEAERGSEGGGGTEGEEIERKKAERK